MINKEHNTITDEEFMELMDALYADAYSIDSIDDIQNLAKEKGYDLFHYCSSEWRLMKRTEEGLFPLQIVSRIVYNRLLTTVEPWEECVDQSEENIKLTLGISTRDNPIILPTWKNFRLVGPDRASTCTRLMPVVVINCLLQKHQITDVEMIFEMARKLLPFGTRHFGKNEFDIPRDADVPWSWTTPFFICYAPGELEAIADTCAEVIKRVKTIDDLREYDMNKFKKLLRDRAKSIPCTGDIAMFGRHIYGSGLNEFESAVSFSMPMKIS